MDVQKVADQWVTPTYISWYLHDEEITAPHTEDAPPAVPRVGDRFVWSDGSRYVVEDVWQSFDKHGWLDRGHHVYLREATPEEDRPLRLHPQYFANSTD
ncbi:hypothetical protein [uncultured Pseudokineococcus sp.]|uniref:hypothetical protein n=1 Tax=uncultured Pseudokineococcus sp. TaxID=1642928 RepID=UPI0026266E37|nr:hypothetical protein [uncultured Pseudokineococcus sp.]